MTAPKPSKLPPALMELSSPDGYYSYLGIPKNDSEIDEDAVNKQYRKLSLKHHPDRPGGDAETFRLLNRAQLVLKDAKLRRQYDILGLDLDDESDDHKPQTESGDVPDEEKGLIHDIASMILAAIIQMAVRTLMMGVVAVVVVRYKVTLGPTLLFLAFIGYRIFSAPASEKSDIFSPLLIAVGLSIMYREREAWSWWFWLGEALVVGMFTFNSIPTAKSPPVVVGIAVFSGLASLWFRGNMWNYAIVVGLQALFAIFVALSFPIMEMVLEAILNDKLKKVGDKVRAHHQQMKAYYSS